MAANRAEVRRRQCSRRAPWAPPAEPGRLGGPEALVEVDPPGEVRANQRWPDQPAALRSPPGSTDRRCGDRKSDRTQYPPGRPPERLGEPVRLATEREP